MAFDFLWLELGACREGRDVSEHDFVKDWVVAVSLEAFADHEASFDVNIIQMREDVQDNLSGED